MGSEQKRPGEFAGGTDTLMRSTLGGRRLLIARLGWLIVFVLSVGLFLASIPAQYHSIVTFSDSDFDPATVRASLEATGITVQFYAICLLSIAFVSTVVWDTVALVIFWRGADNWIALFASVALVMFGTMSLPPTIPAPSNHSSALWLPIYLVAFFGTIALFAFYLLFPSGRFVPRWTRWAVGLFAAHDVFYWLFPGTIFDISSSSPPLDYAVLTTLACIAIGSQLYRFRYVSSPTEQQQTKWVVFGMVVAGLGTVAFEIPISGTPLGQFNPLPALAIQAGLFASLLLIPLSIGVAIVQNRLWDIDIVIRRTLIYGILTVSLALVYFGSVAVTQTVFHALTRKVDQPQLAIVVSTLIIAALFNPSRRRIKSFIDRRFFRSKYDARKTLEAFSATLSRETDLDALSDDLVTVVERTMQPAHVSLWLRPQKESR